MFAFEFAFDCEAYLPNNFNIPMCDILTSAGGVITLIFRVLFD